MWVLKNCLDALVAYIYIFKKMSLPGQIRFVTLKHVSSIDAITGSNEETTTLVGYLPPGESLAPDCHRVVVDWLTLTPTLTLTCTLPSSQQRRRHWPEIILYV